MNTSTLENGCQTRRFSVLIRDFLVKNMSLDNYSSIKKVGKMDQVSKVIIAVIACFGTIATVISQFFGLQLFTGAASSLAISNTVITGFFIGVLGIVMISVRSSFTPRKVKRGLEFYPQTQNEARVLSYTNNAGYAD